MKAATLGIVTLLAIYLSAGVASARQNTDCVPIPFVIPPVALVEPQVAPIFDPRGIWIEFSVIPFGGTSARCAGTAHR
jgi:hypothetical protein